MSRAFVDRAPRVPLQPLHDLEMELVGTGEKVKLHNVSSTGVGAALASFASAAPPAPGAVIEPLRFLSELDLFPILATGLMGSTQGVSVDELCSWMVDEGLRVSPALFTAAFFLEPAPKKLGRPIVLCGLVLAVTGSVLHTLVSYESERA